MDEAIHFIYDRPVYSGQTWPAALQYVQDNLLSIVGVAKVAIVMSVAAVVIAFQRRDHEVESLGPSTVGLSPADRRIRHLCRLAAVVTLSVSLLAVPLLVYLDVGAENKFWWRPI